MLIMIVSVYYMGDCYTIKYRTRYFGTLKGKKGNNIK